MVSEILVVGLSSGDCECLCASLDPHGGEGASLVHRAIVNGSAPSEVAAMLDRPGADGSQFVLGIYMPPGTYLQRQISAEGSKQTVADLVRFATDVLVRWQSYHLALLRLSRRYPSAVSLLNGSRPINIAILSDRLKEKLGSQTGIVGAALDSIGADGGAYGQAVTQIVEGLVPECLDLYAELESCAELTGREPEFEFDGLAQRQGARIELLQLLVAHQLDRHDRDHLRGLARNLESQLQEVQKERHAAVQLADQRLQEKEFASRALGDAKSKIASAELASRVLQGDKELLTLELQRALEQIKRLTASSLQDAEKLGQLRSQVAETEATLSSKDAELIELRQEQQALGSQYELVTLQLQQALAELEHLSASSQQDAEQLCRFKLAIESAEAKLSGKEVQFAELQQTAESLRSQIQILAHQREQDLKNHEQLLSASYRDAEQISQFKSAIESVEATLSETEARLLEAQQENASLRSQIQLLTHQHEQDLEAHEQLLSASLQSADQLSHFRATVESVAANLSEKEAQLEKALQEKEATSSQLSQMNARNLDLEKQLTTQKSEGELYLLQLHQVQEELEHYFSKYKEQSGELQLLKAEQEAQSRSIWRRLFPQRAAVVSSNTLALPRRKQFAVANLIAAQKKKRGIKSQARQIRESGLFDEKWYLHHYPDIAEAGYDPVVHYIRFGAKEGRNPSPAFDTRWYLKNHLDVARTEFNPLLHYIKFGRNEGRQTMRSSD